ncbi:MAG TPA: hypothetical protein VIM05_04475 [Gaiellaceae bacterium]|jgi:uncharacterized protein (DUF433 family)
MAKGQPLSIRLTDATALLVGDEARRSGRSRSAVVEELADEAAKMRLFPGIGFRDHPRRAWVIGTGLDVWQVVDLLDAYRGSVKKLCRDYPLVSERALRIAQAYAERFPAEIEEFLALQQRTPEELQELYPFIEFREI